MNPSIASSTISAPLSDAHQGIAVHAHAALRAIPYTCFHDKTKALIYVFCTFLLTMVAKEFIYESHCDHQIANLKDVRENRSMKNATKKAAKKAPAKKAAAKKKK